ncbi:MAG: TlpA family protein disulfide reductase [Gammaproteobacteria bacterium]|nr:MAG: TlpA family protein disulfide reductase [Gammaproteobacteria bacterium]
MLKKIPLLIFLIICLVAGIGLRLNGPLTSATPAQASSNYQFALPDLNGQLQQSDQWGGKLLIVNFWASWCAPCLEEMPRFITLQKQYGEQGVQFVGIGIDQPDALAKIVDRLGVNYPVLQGDFDAMQVAKQFGNAYGVLPYTSIISPNGQLVTEIAGAVREGEMESLIVEYLANRNAP